jgi:hypothetical protein
MMGMRSGLFAETHRRLIAAPAPIFWALLITLFGAAAILSVRPDATPSDIRVRNDTGLPLSAVLVNGVGYGDIAAGGVTSYLEHKRAYELASFKLNVQGIPVQVQLDNHFGMKTLGPGNFTYVVSLRKAGDIKSVQIHAQRE